MIFRAMRAGALPALFMTGAACAGAAPSPADLVYRNGVIFTADSANTRAQAVAIRAGKFVFIGADAGLEGFVGPKTQNVDLEGRFMMPGIVDGHMHPLEAGTKLLHCSLDYEALTVPQFQQRIQACLDADKSKEPASWLEVVNWFQENMQPLGVATTRSTLDVLKTRRPIVVWSSFGHTALANSRAVSMAKLSAATPEPIGGKIWRDAKGEPTGLLEDSAQSVLSTLLPKPTLQQNMLAAGKSLKAMNEQGVTSFLDADAHPEDLAAFSAVRKAGELTARAHMAPAIRPNEADAIDAAVARIVADRKIYDDGPVGRKPTVTVRNAKLFLDGVIAAPALTGSVIEPYRRNAGTTAAPNWVRGDNRGPPVYFAPDVLAKILIALGRESIDPHLHADGDGAVRAALDGIEAMRKALPSAEIRPAIAHDEIVSAADLPRYQPLGAIAVLSLQWGKPAGDTIGLQDYFGAERMRVLEPSGRLATAGARIAFGSDWPVDKLDEWFAFKVGVTRTNGPDAPIELRGRLGDDPGLSREAVLRAATIDASYELHQDDVTGSIEVGKFADLIVLDRNPLTVPVADIANVRVLETRVGGSVVYRRR